nr:hypothetical protein [Candidatus Njordarchaeum guaymaensis]
MSKKTEFPVMSPMITGVLYVLGVLLIMLRAFAPVFIADPAAVLIFNGLLGFLAVFLILWALLSLSMHPVVDANIKTLFFAAALLILVTVLADVFSISVKFGKL